jgi:4-amino-4-deoxy-L-arabinose transferase-like glycosyltransferase
VTRPTVLTRGSWFRSRSAFLRGHADLVLLGVVVLLAALVRLAFALRVPVFVTKDTLEYVEPALNLIAGGPLELAQRRTPVYPLFIAGSVSLLGPELLAITFAQHLLGVGTAALAYTIGRLTFGRMAGLIGGLLAGLSGPLLIYEHYLITEPVFAFLLVAAICLFVAGLRTERRALILLGGVTLGLAALTRPVGQAVLVVLPFAFFAHYRAWRPTLQACALGVAGFALLVVPWAIRNQVVYGTAGAASVGRFLISRSVKHERDFVFYEPDIGALPGEPVERTRARQIAQDVTNKRPEPGQIFQRVRDELGLTEAQTDAMLKDIALEAIMRNPSLWAQGTVEMFSELVRGAPKEESVRWHLDQHNQPRVANQWGSLAYLLGPPTPAQSRELDAAEGLARIFRPTHHERSLIAFFLLGTLVAVVRQRARPALLPALVVLVLLVASAALVGDVPRYRYPIDPLLYAVAAGGLTSLLGLALALTRRAASLGARASRRRASQAPSLPPGRAGRPRSQGTAEVAS